MKKRIINSYLLRSTALLSIFLILSVLSFSQTKQPMEIEVDHLSDEILDEIEKEVAEDELSDMDSTIDTDGDGVMDDADLCPKKQGSLKFYGCPEISGKYVWDYFEYEVYPKHSKLIVTPATFETITEKVLHKPSHKEGATFEEIQVPITKIGASSRLEATDPKFKAVESEVLMDEITNKKITITKYELVTPVSVKEVAVPIEKGTYTAYKLIEDGNGATVEPEYTSYTKKILSTPASTKEEVIPAVKKVIKVRKSIFSETENEVEIIEEEVKEEEIEEIFTIVETMCQFPRGEEALFKYITKNLKYPKEAKENDIQGTVVVGFIVRSNGTITDIEIIRDIGSGCGEEAVRLVEEMPNWLPGMQRGVPVHIAFKLPIRFSL